MSFLRLIHRDMEAWLADSENQPIPHGEVNVNGNTISTSVSLPKDAEYTVQWCSHPGTAHTAFCEIFEQRKKTRVSIHCMDKFKPKTQIQSSRGDIRNTDWGWLNAPAPSKQANIELHIRRAEGTPTQVFKNGFKDIEIELNLIDDANEDKKPFVIFRFNFVPPPKPKRNAVAGPSTPKSTVPAKRKQPPRGQSPSRSTARRARQESPDRSGPRDLSPPLDGENSDAGQDGADVLALLNAARAEEEKLDAELIVQLQATKKRIEEKKRLLRK
ncbi:hypothetical protein B0H13DRAFT_2666864 [Mycena leptocephala]|nr:hypothetical protein B0H13DRAFT_2666864 [Mycena leptocephala]